MSEHKQYIKYKISRQGDGSYVILQSYVGNKKKVDIHSWHDTYEDAHDALTDLHHKPSQAETIKFLNDLKDSIKNI